MDQSDPQAQPSAVQPPPAYTGQGQQPSIQAPPSETSSYQQPSIQAPKSPKKLIVAIFILVLILGLGLIYLFLSRSSGQEASVSQKVVSTPTPTQPRVEPTQVPGVSHYVGYQSTTLRDTAGTNFSARAYRSVIPGHIFVAVYANLPDPEEGKFYQMWLKHEVNNFFPAGRLFKDANGRYTTVFGFEFDSSVPFFRTVDGLPNTVAVALETVDDTAMETKILEGTFSE